jgi:hypothetical protein
MKKILTKEQEQKKKTRNQLIIGFILIGLMMLSTAGYAFNNGNDEDQTYKIKFKGIDFIKSNDYWMFEKDALTYATTYNPNEVNDVPITNSFNIELYKDKPLYFVDKEGVQNIELARNFNSVALRIQSACLDNNCSQNYPIKSCASDNIIVYNLPKDNENERVYQNLKCVYIIASEENQTRVSDAFLFNTLFGKI